MFFATNNIFCRVVLWFCHVQNMPLPQRASRAWPPSSPMPSRGWQILNLQSLLQHTSTARSQLAATILKSKTIFYTKKIVFFSVRWSSFLVYFHLKNKYRLAPSRTRKSWSCQTIWLRRSTCTVSAVSTSLNRMLLSFRFVIESILPTFYEQIFRFLYIFYGPPILNLHKKAK